MQKSLSHLPEYKQVELQAITQLIHENVPVEMTILFGSFARGNWVEEKYEGTSHFRYQSDFDILVIIDNRSIRAQAKMELELEDAIEQHGATNTPTSILVHDIEFINQCLRKTQYFFSDIKREGILLYDSQRFQLKEAKELSLKDRQHLAQEDFLYWYESAQDFYESSHFNTKRGKFSIAAFELHQTTERLFSTILLVFTRYKPNTHDLRTLRKMVSSIDDRFGQVFLLNNRENKQLFNLLRAAYVDARYKKSYTITHNELLSLQGKVEQLQSLTKQLCEDKIATFID